MDQYITLESTKVFFSPTNGAEVYELEILAGGASFSQTFTETTFSTKTIHEPGSFISDGVFKKANPASFSFTVPLYDTGHPLWNYLVNTNSSNNLDSFTLWFIDKNKVFALTDCILVGGTFSSTRGQVLSISLEGEGSRLLTGTIDPRNYIYGDSYLDFAKITSERTSAGLSSFPTFQSSDILNFEGNIIWLNKVYFSDSVIDSFNNGYDIAVSDLWTDNIISMTLELQNNISWVPYETVQGASEVTAETTQYPSDFVLTERVLAGNTKIAIDTDTLGIFENAINTGLNQKFFQAISLKVGLLQETPSSGDTGVSYLVSNGVNASSRVVPGPFYTYEIDWRHATNAQSLQNYLTFNTA